MTFGKGWLVEADDWVEDEYSKLAKEILRDFLKTPNGNVNQWRHKWPSDE